MSFGTGVTIIISVELVVFFVALNRLPTRMHYVWLAQAVYNLIMMVVCILAAPAYDHSLAAEAFGAAVVAAFFAWHNWPRGRRRKAVKLIGAKARAARDRLVAAMPKLTPVPA